MRRALTLRAVPAEALAGKLPAIGIRFRYQGRLWEIVLWDPTYERLVVEDVPEVR